MAAKTGEASRNFLLERTGRLGQVGGITPLMYAEGKANGVSTLRVRTMTGLEFWVVPDRGMDIFEASFLGLSLCWQSPTGMVHPSFYSNRGIEWLKNFAGGLLSTCGLTTAGAPSEDGGEILGLHGSISNTPAEQVHWTEQWDGDDCLFTIRGKVRETSVHGANLLLERTITTSLKSSTLSIRDVVENQGYNESPLMVLYHCNFGFPLLTERSRVYAPAETTEPANEWSAQSAGEWSSFGAPKKGGAERVYFHRMKADAEGRVAVILVSDDDRKDFGLALRYKSDTLPEFTQWKMTAANHFVLGLEPGNCRSLGRAAERQRGTLQMLAPGERREFHLQMSVLNGTDEIAEAIRLTQI